MIDSFARAMWVKFIATDAQIEGFVDGNDPPGTLKIIRTLVENGIFDAGDVSPHLQALWPVVCDFNHGGGRMVVRHLTSTDVGSSFDEEELDQSLHIADFIVLGAACALSDVMENSELRDAFLARLS